MKFSFLYIAITAVIAASLASCTSTKNLQILQGAFDSSRAAAYSVPDAIIQKGDILAITVFSKSKAASEIYNQQMGSSSAGTSAAAPGYLVDNQGDIQFQGLGPMHVEGLTKAQLMQNLTDKLKEYLTDPYCTIRFVNFKITVIGDVAKPGVYTIPAERVNLLEVLGLAGDLNITARRDNIGIIREQNGKREFGKIDLRQPDIFKSPFYQLKQNDVIYVDLNKTKASVNDQTTIRNITLGATLVSTLALIITILRK